MHDIKNTVIPKHWDAMQFDAGCYQVEFSGKWEGISCVEAQEETESENGWIIREWFISDGAWGGGTKKMRKKFFGKVSIVRVK